jgi:phage shock protein A
MELLVCVLVAMNIFMAEELAESKGTTLIDLAVNPVKRFANKAINKAKDMAHKAVTTVIDTKDKAVVVAKETVDKCEVAVNKAVSDMTNFAVTNIRVAEEIIVKNTYIYKEIQTNNDVLLAQISELQAKVDDITDKYNALENKKQVVNRPKNAKKPAKVDNPFAIEHIDGFDATKITYVRDEDGNIRATDIVYEQVTNE